LRLRIICCDVLEEEMVFLKSNTEHELDFEYTKKSEHEKPDELNERIQAIINNSKGYDAILLGYGLCGNALLGINARDTRLVVPRAHDCCTLFLGSRERFNAIFEDRESMGWGSTGYCRKEGQYLRNSDTGSIIGYDKTYDEYVTEYGKENADFIWQSLHPDWKSNEVMWINIPETFDKKVYDEFVKEAESDNKKVFTETGSMELLRKFVTGVWDDDFLVVEPGSSVQAIYDKHEIIRSTA